MSEVRDMLNPGPPEMLFFIATLLSLERFAKCRTRQERQYEFFNNLVRSESIDGIEA